MKKRDAARAYRAGAYGKEALKKGEKIVDIKPYFEDMTFEENQTALK
ncbi:MAG: hypothetical protein ACLS69_09685 [Butyricicoccus sp.]